MTLFAHCQKDSRPTSEIEVSYFLVGTSVLVLGFIVVDVLTPGKLRQLVFVDRRPNAVILACANYIAVAAPALNLVHHLSKKAENFAAFAGSSFVHRFISRARCMDSIRPLRPMCRARSSLLWATSSNSPGSEPGSPWAQCV